jgi:nickel-dependent lactate racemase
LHLDFFLARGAAGGSFICNFDFIMNVISTVAPKGQAVASETVAGLIAQAFPAHDYRGRKVLLIIPDGTRTAPVGLMFKALHRQIGGVTAAFDALIALGTHQPMSDAAICTRLEISAAERAGVYKNVRVFNHEWDNPAALTTIGTLTTADTRELSEGRMELDVPVEINKRIFDYDQIIIIGPVFPHEVVGFSGGNKYLFPGVAGPEILNFFHWLGGCVTNPMTIGNKWTPVRRVVDRVGAMVKVEKLCLAIIVRPDKSLAGLFIGTPEDAWDGAAEVSRREHIVYCDRPFRTILSCAPTMYEDVWTAGKAMYKLEPVVADGGELIIYAPHVTSVSVTHSKTLLEVGYHCRDYFLKQWDKFKHRPWGVLAHSTHVRGIGTFENGVERCRVQVTLATGIPENVCRQINLGYRDPRSIDIESFANREHEGVLLVRKAGEMLYKLADPPAWQKGVDKQ